MLSFLGGTDIFNQHTNSEAIKNILAVLMINVVKADKKITQKEQKKVLDFFQNEFGMDKDRTINIFNSVRHDATEFNSSLIELKYILSNDVTAKAKVLQHLNSIIICDGCIDEEYVVFEEVKSYLL